ncbi:MAG TPA: hypothetical protein VF623_14140 [Segetibacter sp.]
MFLVSSYIQIGDYYFDHCVGVEIVNSIESLTDTCIIFLPRKYTFDKKEFFIGDQPAIKRFDKVLVKFGYDGNLTTEFIGYVKDVKPGVPVVVECEDSMMLLKTTSLTYTFPKGAKLRDVLSHILPKGIKFSCVDLEVGPLRCSNMTAAQILEELKRRYLLHAFFRLIENKELLKLGFASGVAISQLLVTESVLFVGLPYLELLNDRKEETFEISYNIINHDDLLYRHKDEIRFKIRVVIIDERNKRKEFEVGDDDGETRTVHYYNKSLEQAKQMAYSDLNRFKYTGYRGSFLTFGEPSVQKGDVAHIEGDKYHPKGKYLIPRIEKSLGAKIGIRQTVQVGQLINDMKK